MSLKGCRGTEVLGLKGLPLLVGIPPGIPGQLGGDASDVGELTWKKSFEFMESCLFPERIYSGGREELPASSHPPGPPGQCTSEPS